MHADATILLLGKNGQLGFALQRALAPIGRVMALGRAEADFAGADADALSALVQAHRPQVVVNAAAYTAVDAAEDDEPGATRVNATAPAALARACEREGAWLIHYSTDYVFDGALTRPYTESDPASPLNAYGRTKLAGEQAVAAACARHVILRTSWLYAAYGGNFLRTILRAAGERDELRVVADQHGAPTGADLLADVTAQIVRGLGATPSPAGLYHLTAAGATTWYDYAVFAIAHARARGATLRATPQSVVPIASAERASRAQRPAHAVLDCDKARRRFDLRLPPWEAGVAHAIDALLAR